MVEGARRRLAHCSLSLRFQQRRCLLPSHGQLLVQRLAQVMEVDARFFDRGIDRIYDNPTYIPAPNGPSIYPAPQQFYPNPPYPAIPPSTSAASNQSSGKK